MTRFTKAQRDYQTLLLDGGLPEVLAFMAAQRILEREYKPCKDAVDALWQGFIWNDTDEGHDFWQAIVAELSEGGV